MPHDRKHRSRSPEHHSREPRLDNKSSESKVKRDYSSGEFRASDRVSVKERNHCKDSDRKHSRSPQRERHHHHHHHHHHRYHDSPPASQGSWHRSRDKPLSPPLDPHRHIKQEPADSSSTEQQQQLQPSRWESEREINDRKRVENRRRREHEPRHSRNKNGGEDEFEYGKPDLDQHANGNPPVEKEKPNFGLSGKLTEDTNTYRGIVIKYNEPPEARKPKKKWRLYPFKGEQNLPVLHLHRQSGYLIGRERKIADIPIDHPSCSKQHAVLQFRAVDYQRDDGSAGRRIRPYIIDLNSANGSYVNNQRVEAQRYLELFEKDVLKFGFSTREYVLLHDSVDTSELNDEVVDSTGAE